MPKLPKRDLSYLEESIARMRRLETAWGALYNIIAAYPAPDAPRGDLEMHFLNAKSALARELPVAVAQLGGEATFTNEPINFLAGLASLHALYAQSEVAVNKAKGEWHRCYLSLHETLGVAQEAYRRADGGERVLFGGYEYYRPAPRPWGRIAAVSAAVLLVVALAAGTYVRREFLGIGAPGAGEGILQDASLSDTAQMTHLSNVMTDALKSENVDLFMAMFADDFTSSMGLDKTQLRVLMVGFLKSYGSANIQFDLSGAKTTIDGAMAMLDPVRVVTPVESVGLRIIGRKEDGQWLISRIEEL